MLLRASAEHDNTTDDIAALKDGTGGGVERELSVPSSSFAMGLNKEKLAAVLKENRENPATLLFRYCCRYRDFQSDGPDRGRDGNAGRGLRSGTVELRREIGIYTRR